MKKILLTCAALAVALCAAPNLELGHLNENAEPTLNVLEDFLKPSTDEEAKKLEAVKDSIIIPQLRLAQKGIDEYVKVEDVKIYDLGQVASFKAKLVRFELNKNSIGTQFISPDSLMYVFGNYTTNVLTSLDGKPTGVQNDFYQIMGSRLAKALSANKDRVILINTNETDDLNRIVFIDPSCAHCYDHLKRMVENFTGERTAIVLTSILGGISHKKAAYISKHVNQISGGKNRISYIIKTMEELAQPVISLQDYNQITEKEVERSKEADAQWLLFNVTSVPADYPLIPYIEK